MDRETKKHELAAKPCESVRGGETKDGGKRKVSMAAVKAAVVAVVAVVVMKQ